jgi:hypothetical protein
VRAFSVGVCSVMLKPDDLEAKQRRQRGAARLPWVRSAVTSQVKHVAAAFAQICAVHAAA